MRLTQEQSRQVWAKHGCFVSECCDQCSTLIHYANRSTRKDHPGVWCSRLCRDGVDHQPGVCRSCGAALAGRRKGAMFCSDVCRKRQAGQDRQIIAETPIADKGLTDAIFGR